MTSSTITVPVNFKFLDFSFHVLYIEYTGTEIKKSTLLIYVKIYSSCQIIDFYTYIDHKKKEQ